MVGGTTPPQSDSGEISRVLVLNLLWQSKRCSRTAQDISVLTTPSLLSRAPSCWECGKSGATRHPGLWGLGDTREPTRLHPGSARRRTRPLRTDAYPDRS